MAILGVKTTKQRHRKKTVETKDTYHILKAKGGWFGWEKS